MHEPSLQTEHDLLVVATSQFASMIAKPEAPDPLESFQLRRTFGLLLVTHLKRTLWEIYPQRLANPDRKTAADASLAIREAAELAHEFADHSQRWTNDTIASGWPLYRKDAAKLIRSVRSFLAREQQDLLEEEVAVRGFRLLLTRASSGRSRASHLRSSAFPANDEVAEGAGVMKSVVRHSADRGRAEAWT